VVGARVMNVPTTLIETMRNVIDKYAALPFEYGLDCCQFAGECVESITGHNPMDSLSYSNEQEAHGVIESFGGLENAMCHFLGEPYDGIKDGDVCIMDDNKGNKIAAVIYRGRIVARVGGGLMDYPTGRAEKVWCI